MGRLFRSGLRRACWDVWALEGECEWPPILQNAGGVTWTAAVREKKSGNGAVLVWSFFIYVS